MINNSLEQEVVDALTDGRKIEAIKILRNKRNIDLKESKELIEQYIRDNSNTMSQSQTNRSINGILFLIAMAGIAYLVYENVL